jgi:uncharacterized protein (TIGR00251 family)
VALLNVKVVPGARRTEVVGRHGDGVKIRVAAPPEGGKANQAMLDVLAGALGVKQSAMRIVRGQTSPQKVVAIEGLELDAIWAKLDRTK